MRLNPNCPRELIRMKWRLPLAVWLVYCSFAAAQEAPKTYVRFFNDSAKSANFYVDGKFGCLIPANPEGNNAWCDAEAAIGKHSVSVKRGKLRGQSCELYVIDRGLAEAGAEAHLSKGALLHCMSFATVD
jgi:hypothetical protein